VQGHFWQAGGRGNPYFQAPLRNSNARVIQPEGDAALERERRSITRTMFSESKDGGGGHVEASLVQRDLQYVETLGDMASDFFVGLALRGCLVYSLRWLAKLRFKLHARLLSVISVATGNSANAGQLQVRAWSR
jgi:hypothetical protein